MPDLVYVDRRGMARAEVVAEIRTPGDAPAVTWQSETVVITPLDG